MIQRFTIKLCVLGAMALCVATNSDAFTLGRTRGGALLGQPLELTVPVQIAPDEALLTECFDAEVFYGENRQDAARVKVNVSETTPGLGFSVKVISLAAIDEPVVTVYLRGGCNQKTTRKYVLLADMASEPASVATAVPPSVRTTTVLSDVRSTSNNAAGHMVVPSQTAESPVVAKKQKAQTKPSDSNTRLSSRLVPPEASAQVRSKKSRLKLSALDLPERDPILQLSNELLSSPVEDLQKRAEAVAIWRSLNETAQDVLNEQARMRALDGDLKALRDQTAKNQTQLMELGTRLEKAEAQRYANPLVYGLILLLLVLVGGLIWAWRQLKDVKVVPYPWWSGAADKQDREHLDLPLDGAIRETVASADSRAGVAPSEKTQTLPAQTIASQYGVSSVDIDIDVDLEMGPSVFAPMARSVSSADVEKKLHSLPKDQPRADFGVRDFAHSVAGTLRAINSAELLDVRQQADFFMTLGQYEDAIHLLAADISEGGVANPLVYLDLLKILHTLSRKEQFEQYRKEFNSLFAGEVPSYVDFNQSGNRLDQYSDVCREIIEAWNTTEALDVIERYLVKSKDASTQWHFDLEAYRDLLMLHGVLGRLEGEPGSMQAPFSALKTAATAGVGQTDGMPLDSSEADSVNVDTMPLPTMGGNAHHEFDLNLDSGNHNLIDFEVSGFSSTGGPNISKKIT